jgi:hypothetical protein
VEVHTAYHNGPAVPNPLPEDLDQCTREPVVVVGYHAKVTSSSDKASALPIHFGPPAAEWSGSSTGTKPGLCKGPAFWSFTLGCDFTLSLQQLAGRTAEGARKLQPANLLSHDLTKIVPRPKSR